MENVVLNGASDGTVLGTASGVFNTNAASTLGDASGFSAQNLRGISTLDLNLGGNGGINAIVNDTNFVSAHSVSGNATAVATVDAIGLDGGNIHIAGNATILANVGVDSKAEAGTIS
jgi:agmatine/peptidylarginine deiminase